MHVRAGQCALADRAGSRAISAASKQPDGQNAVDHKIDDHSSDEYRRWRMNVAALCNLGITLNRLGGNRELLRDLIRFFGDDAPKLLAQIQAGLQAAEPRQVQLAAHSLAGLAANFEALPCVAVASQMEKYGRAGDLAAAASLLPELEASVQALLTALGLPHDTQSIG